MSFRRGGGAESEGARTFQESSGARQKMHMPLYVFLIILVALSAVWMVALNTSIQALRVSDPALYRAVAHQLAYVRRTSAHRSWLSIPFRPWRMHKWMRHQWRHHDVRRHRLVRKWMYVHQGAHSAMIALLGYAITMLIIG
jgi:hypothetical protein